jgi:hypothetical protein
MNRPHPVEVAVPALTFTVAGWLIGGVVGGAVGAVVGIALGAAASVVGHAENDSFTDAERGEVAEQESG